MEKLVVIALGGNALQVSGEEPTYDNQRKNVEVATTRIVELIESGYKVVITHGNGPQVGRMLIQQAKAESEETPSFPFDAVDAMSQATIGYQIEQVLQNALRKRGIDKKVTTVLTQVVVDREDEAFADPTKPIGPFYTEAEVQELAATSGYTFKPDSDRGYRRVVASPEPVKIVELDSIKALIDNGDVVVCCGGGGIPVFDTDAGYEGTAAVIDKDKATNLLAKKLQADYLVILTAVREAAIHYGTAQQQNLNTVTVAEMIKYASEGHFAPGSMLPKVEATIDFTTVTGNKAIITTLDAVLDAVETGRVGTIITNNHESD
ncbi:carbamate kinase [Mollicutes bacterium LVI A0039]|nr:carbamate kinase [Mollicutes bacterium LVI A0039]